MNIGLDIMGGDFAPKAAIEGVALFLKNNEDTSIRLTLIGNLEASAPYLHLLEQYKDRYAFIPAETTIGMHEHPTKALKEKQNSSIAIGFGLLQMKKIDAFIGAGNTGAMLVGAMYTVKAIPGVLRPTIGSPLPTYKGKFNLLLDVGANADCKPEHLAQFATMGNLYMKHVLNVETPRVGLLNIGEEEGKGNILAQATYPLLKNNSEINFIGNIEGRNVFRNEADVTVCDGFTGNVILKLAESFYDILSEDIGHQGEFISRMNYEDYGGIPILGVNAPVIIGHGISKAKVFNEMINQSIKVINTNFIQVLTDYFAQHLPEEQK